MQTISIPYRCSDEDRLFLDDLRRVQSAAIRTAYAHAVAADGTKPKEMALRNLVKARFSHEGLLDEARHLETEADAGWHSDLRQTVGI